MTLTRTSEVNLTSSVEMGVAMKPSAQEVHISAQVLLLFQWFCYPTCILIDIFGTVTNIINIICFVKQGFKDPVNISLLALAISDLASLVLNIWTALSVVPAFQYADLPFDPVDIAYAVTALPRFIFVRITSCITALITLKRCLCVTMPLKVKNIMTANTVTVVIVCIYSIPVASSIPYFSIMRLTPKFYYEGNKTLIGVVYTSHKDIIELYYFTVNNFLVAFGAFFVTIICMMILVVKLRKQTKWRIKSGSKGDKCATITTDRDLKVSKMVVMISLLFVTCFIPNGVMFLAMAIVPELAAGGKYEDYLMILYGIGALLESTNSSMNVFIYYSMSTKYREVYNQIFSRKQKRLV